MHICLNMHYRSVGDVSTAVHNQPFCSYSNNAHTVLTPMSLFWAQDRRDLYINTSKKKEKSTPSMPPLPPCRRQGLLQSTACKWLPHLMLLHKSPPPNVALNKAARPRARELPQERLSTLRRMRRRHAANWQASVWAGFCQWVLACSK